MFTYRIFNEYEYIMVCPEGELGYDVCEDFRNIVTGCMSPRMRLLFNMSKVSFIDSAGVGFLLSMKKLAESRDGSFEIRNLPKRVKVPLDKLALNEALNVSSVLPHE